jgi:hypothetical protein
VTAARLSGFLDAGEPSAAIDPRYGRIVLRAQPTPVLTAVLDHVSERIGDQVGTDRLPAQHNDLADVTGRSRGEVDGEPLPPAVAGEHDPAG